MQFHCRRGRGGGGWPRHGEADNDKSTRELGKREVVREGEPVAWLLGEHREGSPASGEKRRDAAGHDGWGPQ